MDAETVGKLACQSGSLAIDSKVDGLNYFVHADDARIAIAGNGIAILTKKQAKALLDELPEIIEVFCKNTH